MRSTIGAIVVGIFFCFWSAAAFAGTGVCNRSPVIAEQLSLWSQKPCEAVTDEDLKLILKLEFKRNWGESGPWLKNIKAGDLDGLINLRRIEISDAVSTLPDRLFCNLPSLAAIEISDTDLSALPPNLFCHSKAIRVLNIEGNGRLKRLPDGIFDGLTGLKELTIRGQRDEGLPIIPSKSSKDLTSLELLLLDGARGTLDPAFLGNLKSLNQLIVSDTALNELSPAAFNALPQLKVLVLNQLQDTVFPPAIFQGLKSLRALVIEFGRFKSIPSDLLTGLNLSVFDLRGTNLDTPLSSALLEGMVGLREFSTHAGRVGDLPSDFFRGAPNLVDMDLSYSGQKSLPDGLTEGLGSLETLHLEGNPFTDLSPAVFTGLNLDKLKAITIWKRDLPEASLLSLKQFFGDKIIIE